jgi:hypothetical protein
MTRILYAIPYESRVRLSVHDVRGRVVTVLLDTRLPEGEHSVTWHSLNSTGASTPPGVYFVRLEAGSAADTRKVILLQ